VYLTASRQARLELAAGLIDSDGSLHYMRNAFEFSQSISQHDNVLRDTEILFPQLGFIVHSQPYTYVVNGEEKHSLRLEISGNDIKDIPSCNLAQASLGPVQVAAADVLVRRDAPAGHTDVQMRSCFRPEHIPVQ